jgi:hypothetical protein
MEIKRIIEDQREELSEKAKDRKLIEREIQEHFEKVAGSNLIKVTTGVRRSGKSTLTSMVLTGKGFGYANFDDEILASAEPNQVLSAIFEVYGDVGTIFFDEIQNLDKWELFVNRLQRRGLNLFITGSNAKLLSKELATHLTGRHLPIELFPFSFKEYLRAKGFDQKLETTKGESLVKKMLEDYINEGGFPEVVVEGENPKLYLKELYRNIIERDIILRHNIAYKRTFRELAMSMLSNVGRPVSYNKLKKVFGLGSDHTVKNYLSYLEESYLVLPLSKFSFKPREIERSEKKVYCVDPGFTTRVSLKPTKDTGRLVENLVFLELQRRKSLNPDLELFYYKDARQKEVDFVVREGLKVKQMIQVCYDIGDYDTRQREERNLLTASKDLKCSDLLIITWDHEAEEEVTWRGTKVVVKFVPLWKWLLA